MNAAALFADEGPLEMDPEDFRAGFLRFVLLGHVSGDSFDGTESLFCAGCYRGGDQRCGAVLRDFPGDGAQRRASSLHDIVAAGPVDMQIDEAGNGGLVGCENFLGPCWQGHARPRPDSLDGIFANQDPRLVDFSPRRQGTASMNENEWHCNTTYEPKFIPA